MKVWLVASGEYSDYSVVGLFSSLEAAEEFRRAYPAEGYSETYHEPVEYELDSPLPDPAKRGLSYFQVRMRRNGDVMGVNGASYSAEQFEGLRFWYDKDWDGHKFAELPKDQHVGTFAVWARDKEHAVKVANERRIQILAQQSQPTATPNLSGEQ